jgi:3-hydroxyacyl-CoA dehydrogenase
VRSRADRGGGTSPHAACTPPAPAPRRHRGERNRTAPDSTPAQTPARASAATAPPLHFFPPVPEVALVEIIVGLDTSRETMDTAESFAKRLGKTVIETKDRSGFIVNTLLVPYLMAAVRMYEDGFASRDDIDTGMKLGCGHPLGPLTVCDLIGLDNLYSSASGKPLTVASAATGE